MVIYQYMSALGYRDILLLRFICSYFTFIYNKYVTLRCFVIIHHKTLFISQIPNQFLCDILWHPFLLQTSTSTTSQIYWSPTQRKHWKTGLYQWSADNCEGESEYDLNCLASVIIRQYTIITNQCQRMTWTWTWRIKYFDCWSHFEKRPGRV